ncbi:phosphotriesterase [Paucisalibacillus sp. EB02]|uniref:phosphotriesterase family protein n=1 Tax=Paucisalibacillus sp. EB02 TaxID=1347087 RepID=UPI0004B928B4|nr:hypothetical protein [Paucisalibacillus sp. EB02]
MDTLQIQTVRGFVQQNEVKHFQPHEHIMLEKGQATIFDKNLCIDDFSLTVKELDKLPAHTAIVDAQPIGAGRMTKELVSVAEIANVHIVASTGFHKSMFYWPDHWIEEVSSERLAEVFVSEILHGMYVGNQITFPEEKIHNKAGLIKTAVDKEGISKEYEYKFEAAVEASLRTNATIMVHVEKGSNPLEIINFLLDRNIPAEKIILCHLDRTHHDYSLHQEIAQTGVYLEYDTIGRFKYHDDDTEVQLIYHMLENGFSNSILLSLDTTRARIGSYGGEIGIDYLLKMFVPKLYQYGINKETIHKLLVTNPFNAISI